MGLNKDLLHEHHELFQRLDNSTRVKILAFIYQEPRSYTDLITYTGLKPGSLYHHLNILKPLIQKEKHGFYSITEKGLEIAESLGIVESKRPEISTSELVFQEPLLSDLWLGYVPFVFSALVVTVTILLGFEGVAFAGSAIYAVGKAIVFGFDLAAFLLGWLALFIIEGIFTQNRVYNHVRYSLLIRLISMLPGVILGIALLLLFSAGIIPPPSAYPWIFTISTTLGYLLTVSGLRVLRAQPRERSLYIATVPTLIDLLLGVVVLLVNSS